MPFAKPREFVVLQTEMVGKKRRQRNASVGNRTGYCWWQLYPDSSLKAAMFHLPRPHLTLWQAWLIPERKKKNTLITT
jgi:hypothetical protein